MTTMTTMTMMTAAGTTGPQPRFLWSLPGLRGDPEATVAVRRYLRAYDEIEGITGARLHGKLRAIDSGAQLSPYGIARVADSLRQSCLHGVAPGDVSSALERLGVRVVFSARGGLDGVSAIQGETALVMLRDRQRSIERTIFSAAHELGHLVLHSHLFTSDEGGADPDAMRYEAEANRFADCFLVPGVALIRVWDSERLHRLPLFHALVLLKRVFHVGFHCLYRRVMELELCPAIDDAAFAGQVRRQLGIDGHVKMDDMDGIDDVEPDPLKPESFDRTSRFGRLVRSAFLQDLIGVSKVAEMFQVPVDRAKEIVAGWIKPGYEFCDPD